MKVGTNAISGEHFDHFSPAWLCPEGPGKKQTYLVTDQTGQPKVFSGNAGKMQKMWEIWVDMAAMYPLLNFGATSVQKAAIDDQRGDPISSIPGFHSIVLSTADRSLALPVTWV